MISNRGTNKGSLITGRSIHNSRIKRLCREVNRLVTSHYLAIFRLMGFGCYQWTGFVYPPRCFPASNSHVTRWIYSTVELSWIRTVGHSSHLALWTELWSSIPQCQWWLSGRSSDLWCWLKVPCEDSSGGEIVVPQNQFNLTDEVLFSNIDPMTDDGDSLIQHFCNAMSPVLASLVQ